jgi:hypothetical protein
MSDPLAADTAPEIERLQIDGWRRMTHASKAATVTALTSMAMEMTLAGIRDRFPGEPDDQHRRRLAELLFGEDLAERVLRHRSAL